MAAALSFHHKQNFSSFDMHKYKFKVIANSLQSSYNRFHNILRLFDILPTFLFTPSETMFPNDLRLSILGN